MPFLPLPLQNKSKRRMTSKEDVSRFLRNFKDKSKVFGIIFRDDRGKNQQTLFDLEISGTERREIVMSLVAEDFVEGPLEDTLNNISQMWVFGTRIKETDIYIKISMGHPSSCTICISFHIAERELKYKFKQL